MLAEEDVNLSGSLTDLTGIVISAVDGPARGAV